MGHMRYAIYAPAERDIPWLAVVLMGEKAADTFACPSKEAAEHVLREMQARNEAKNGHAYH